MVEGPKALPIKHLFYGLRVRGRVDEYSYPGLRVFRSPSPPHLLVGSGRFFIKWMTVLRVLCSSASLRKIILLM